MFSEAGNARRHPHVAHPPGRIEDWRYARHRSRTGPCLLTVTGACTYQNCVMQSSRGLDALRRCRLALLPPPESLEGVWAAVAGLPRLRRLDLLHSHTVAPSHLALLAALPALEALDLTGVHLPLSALAPLETLTAVTQLRIPNVKVRLRCEPHACAVPAGGIPAFTGGAP